MKHQFQSWWGRPGWERFIHVIAAASFAVAIAVFWWLAYRAADPDFTKIDERVIRSLRHEGAAVGGAGWVNVMRDVTAMGSAAVLGTVTILILGYLSLAGKFRIALLIAAATAGGQLLNITLKNAFERVRPDMSFHLVHVSSTSFPSGHAMAGSIFYFTLGALLARTASRPREKIYLVAASWLLSMAVGFSRVYLGVHYPSDVAAGWAAGLAWALLCWFVADWLGRQGALRPDTGERASA